MADTTDLEGRIKEFEAVYTSWALLVKTRTEQAHKDHEPKPRRFGLTEEDVKWAKARVDKEMARKF